MELRDLIVTPVILILVFWGAYVVRPWVTDEITRKYFFPALWIRVFGAIALGLLYQFYYKGGDTINYHTHGSRVIWEAFTDSPLNGIKIFFSQGSFEGSLWNISDKLWYWRDAHSFKIVQLAALFDLFTFSTYSATAVLFAVLSFVGAWMLYLTFYKIYPRAYKLLAISCLFIPSVIFWGSGILKDTVTLSFLGIATHILSEFIYNRRISLVRLILLILSFYIIYSIKKYILISFVAGIVVWIASIYFFKIRTKVTRILIIPFVIITCIFLTYFAINKVFEDDSRYSLDKIAETARITAYDIRYGWGARSGEGSGYTLGELDGTILGMLKLAPQAINVSLFRPYLWEMNNPLMLLSALEAIFTFFFTLRILLTLRASLFVYLKNETLFCLVFALIFAFGVGVSTYNFGSLSRYKIPLLPYYWTALVLLYTFWKEEIYRETSD